MHYVVIELSYVDCVLVPGDAGFLVEVIRLGLSGIYPRRITSTRKPASTGTNTQSTYDNSITT